MERSLSEDNAFDAHSNAVESYFADIALLLSYNHIPNSQICPLPFPQPRVDHGEEGVDFEKSIKLEMGRRLLNKGVQKAIKGLTRPMG